MIYELEELLILWIMQPSNCSGASQIFVQSTPDDQAGWTEACPCPNAFKVDLRKEPKFWFSYAGLEEGAEPGSLNNHGVLSPRVWLCAMEVDRNAVVFDWFAQQAVRHFAQSFVAETSDDRLRNALAANVCLRMASAVAASLGETLVHETAHNVSLFHCYDPFTASPRGCEQDMAMAGWWVLAAARLGFGAVSRVWNSTLDYHSLTINWQAPSETDPLGALGIPSKYMFRNGLDEGDFGTKIHHRPPDFEPGDFRLYYEGYVGCHQEGLDSGWRDVAIVALGSVLDALVVPAVSVYLIVAVGQMQYHNLGKEEYGTAADLEFGIDRPLQMGGKILSCCVRHRDEECIGTHASTIPCWLTNPPDDAIGCECPDTSDDEGGRRRGGPGGVPGGPLPPIQFPFGPGTTTDDGPLVMIDGVVLM